MSHPGSAPGPLVAAAARALVGTPFRLHGRDPAHGLDCVGLVHCALDGAGIATVPPGGYRLRNLAIDALLATAPRSGLREAEGPLAPGDVLLIGVGPAQHHLCVALGHDRFVHAHAGLRLVVEHRGVLPGPVLRHWRPHLHPKPEGN